MIRRIFWYAFDKTLGRLIDPIFRNWQLSRHVIFGDVRRVHIDSTAVVNNAHFNTVSGEISIGSYVFFGHGVCLLTGTHDISRRNRERQLAFPTSGRDITVSEGVWIAGNATVLGPCTIGEHSVVAAGAVVVGDVPPYTVVAGVPARKIGDVPR